MTSEGLAPTIHVFVPSRVSVPGLGARTLRMRVTTPRSWQSDRNRRRGSLEALARTERRSSNRIIRGRLRDRIAAEGPITFAEFMEAALYDPDGGFYSRLPVGEEAHFVTSPHLSPVFGRLVARQVAEFWGLLDRPARFGVIEVG